MARDHDKEINKKLKDTLGELTYRKREIMLRFYEKVLYGYNSL
jgi:hypothetical protein